MIPEDYRKNITGIYEVYLVVDKDTKELNLIYWTEESAHMQRRPYQDDIYKLKGKAKVVSLARPSGDPGRG